LGGLAAREDVDVRRERNSRSRADLKNKGKADGFLGSTERTGHRREIALTGSSGSICTPWRCRGAAFESRLRLAEIDGAAAGAALRRCAPETPASDVLVSDVHIAANLPISSTSFSHS
jgi:hypothetical protein